MSFTVGSIVSKLQLDKKGWNQAIGEVKKDQTKMGTWAKNNSAQMKKMGTAMTVVGGAIVGSLGLMVKKYVETGDWIDKMTKRTGFSATALSELAHAADISGASLTDVEKGVKKMAKTIVDADEGLETYIRSFRRIGVSVDDLMEMNPEQQFITITEAIAGLEDPTLRAATAQEIFGRAGTTLLPLMAEGKEGLKALRQEAHTLGIVFDEEAAAKAAKLKDEQTRLKRSMQGVGFALSETIIPAITSLATKITEVIKKVSAWMKEHPGLTGGLVKTAAAVGGILTVLGPLIFMLPNLVKGIKLVKLAMTKGRLATMGWMAVVALSVSKVVKLIKVLKQLKKAKEHLKQATENEATAEKQLEARLLKISKRAGLTAKEFDDLTKKYNGNTNALAFAIRKGKEGVEFQEAMAEHAKETNAAIEAETESIEDLGDEAEIAGTKIELLTNEIKQMITPSEMLQQAIDDVKNSFAEFPIELESVRPAMEDIIGGIGLSVDELNEKALESVGITSQSMLDTTLAAMDKAKIQAEKTQKIVDGLSRDMGNSFGAFFADVVTEGGTFKEKLDTLWSNIKGSFVATGAQMVSDFIAEFVKKKIFQPILDAFSGLFSDINAEASASGSIAGDAWGSAFVAFAMVWLDGILHPDKWLKKVKGDVIPAIFDTSPPLVNIPDLTPKVFPGATTPGGFADGGSFEVGPHQPTGFIAGEGSRRESVMITPNSPGVSPGGGQGLQIHINGPLFAPVGFSRADIEQSSEIFFEVMQREASREV